MRQQSADVNAAEGFSGKKKEKKRTFVISNMQEVAGEVALRVTCKLAAAARGAAGRETGALS